MQYGHQDGAQDLLRAALGKFAQGLAAAAGLSLFLSLLQLVVPAFMIQVYDRVMSSHSMETLLMLIIVSLGGLAVMGVLDFLRGRIYLVMAEATARHLNLPTLQASLSETLHGDPSVATQATRNRSPPRRPAISTICAASSPARRSACRSTCCGCRSTSPCWC